MIIGGVPLRHTSVVYVPMVKVLLKVMKSAWEYIYLHQYNHNHNITLCPK